MTAAQFSLFQEDMVVIIGLLGSIAGAILAIAIFGRGRK